MKNNKINKIRFGKSIEYLIMSKMLQDGLDVYSALADDHGVDCIINTKKNKFIKIQIKGRSSKSDIKSVNCFTVDKHEQTRNFYFIFYYEAENKMWIMSSNDFIKNTKEYSKLHRRNMRPFVIKKGKYISNKKFEKYLKDDFSIFKEM